MDNLMFGEDARKKPNTLPSWGNSSTMNLNPLILTNIQTSPYFRGPLSELKTYHEVVDEIYYKVNHLEPWEKGSRRTAGQTGMCGGVRGVGAGGIISTAFCLLYKLFTMRLTRKQVNGLLNHRDSPYIRSLGFMYIRFTQPPADLWEWFEPYIDDPEEVDVRAGSGQVMMIGEMCRLFLTKLDWFSSLFPRIPVPIQIGIDKKLAALKHATSTDAVPRKGDDEEDNGPAEASPPVSLRSRDDSSRGLSHHRSDGKSERVGNSKSSSRRTHPQSSNRHRSRSRSRSRSSSRDRRRSEERNSYSSSHHSSSSSSRRRDRSRSPDRHVPHTSSRHSSSKYSSSSHRHDYDRRDRR